MARPLKVFMRGKSIALLQEVLRRIGYPIHDQKGLFGVDTRDAVKNFQKQQGLKPTGQVDEALMQLMQHGQPAMPQEKQPLEKIEEVVEGQVTQQQFDVLLRLLVRKGLIEEGEFAAKIKKMAPTHL